MLTDVDIHYLVGLFCRITNPENVDVILGDRVYNEASNSRRDVDITITYKNKAGDDCAVSGIEVKAHAKPLDVHHVEQLCAKLKTHPSLSYRQIVSASGYTKGARAAAEYYGVDLLRLDKWDFSKYGFAHVAYHEGMSFTEISFSWVGSPHVIFNPGMALLQNQRDLFTSDCKVVDQGGKPIDGIANLGDLAGRMIHNALDSAKNAPSFQAIPLNIAQHVVIDVSISDKPIINYPGGSLQLVAARVEGDIKRDQFEMRPEYKVLVFDSTDELMIGTAITELQSGTLFGLTISSQNRDISAAVIPISERLRKKVFMHRI